jgi:hypothetical protein
MGQPGYVEERGDYDGRQWFGDIWTFRNMSVVKGLEDSHQDALAAQLNWETIKEFHDKYREFIYPSDGEAGSATDYAWSASQYIRAVIEHLFGIDYDAVVHRITVAPRLPKQLWAKDIRIENLVLPTSSNTRLAVRIKQSSRTSAVMDVHIEGELPKGDFSFALPSGNRFIHIPISRTASVKF